MTKPETPRTEMYPGSVTPPRRYVSAAGSDDLLVKIRGMVREEMTDLHEAVDEYRGRLDGFDRIFAQLEMRLKTNERLLHEMIALLQASPVRRISRPIMPAALVPVTDADLANGGDFLTQIENPKGPKPGVVTIVPAWTKTDPETGKPCYKGIRRYGTKSPMRKWREASEFFRVPEGWGPGDERDEAGPGDSDLEN